MHIDTAFQYKYKNSNTKYESLHFNKRQKLMNSEFSNYQMQSYFSYWYEGNLSY